MFGIMNTMYSLVYFGSLFLMIHKLHASDTVVTDIVAFDITIGGEDVGTIEIGLFGDTAPRTVKNFVQFASGEGEYSYEGSPFHRVIDNFMVQGGDVLYGNGTGETSIYGGRFEDEPFILQHYGAGWLSMANAGTDTNTCQFFITAKQTYWLDDKHVVFGKVMRGMWTLRQILNVETDPDSNRPKVEVLIAKSTVSKPKEPTTLAKAGADWLI